MEGPVGADTLSGTVALDYAQTPDMEQNRQNCDQHYWYAVK